MKLKLKFKIRHLILSLVVVSALNVLAVEPSDTSTTVYICGGTAAKCYHIDHFCKGLSNCSDYVIEIDKDSIPPVYRLCKLCDKQRKSNIYKKHKRTTAKSKANNHAAKVMPRTNIDEKVPEL